MTPSSFDHVTGRHVEVTLHNLTIIARIVEVKRAYGRVLIAVTPVAGAGVSWFDAGKLTLLDESGAVN